MNKGNEQIIKESSDFKGEVFPFSFELYKRCSVTGNSHERTHFRSNRVLEIRANDGRLVMAIERIDQENAGEREI